DADRRWVAHEGRRPDATHRRSRADGDDGGRGRRGDDETVHGRDGQAGADAGRAGGSSERQLGMMSTSLRSPRLRKETFPATRANSVSSDPRPTLKPACTRVPRWRTMIDPAVTT